jgi:hypothetical protein
VEASHMSVYGYVRETTPYLKELAESALVAENAFSNFHHTTGSIFSIYTGKYPAKTRLFFSPNILEGVDAHEHLPGILRSLGYRTVQITIPLFLDANKFNLLGAFDEIQMNSTIHSKYLNTIRKAMPTDKALFIDETTNRIFDRLCHIFFIQKMINSYININKMNVLRVDMERWMYLKQEIKKTQQPLFVHIHLMCTHGHIFNPGDQISRLANQSRPRNPGVWIFMTIVFLNSTIMLVS